MSVEPLDVPRAAATPLTGHRVLLPRGVMKDGATRLLVHLGPVAAPTGACASFPARVEAVSAKDRVDLGVAAAAPVAARTVPALVAQGVGRVPRALGRHPTPRDAAVPIGVQVRRPLGGEPPAKTRVGTTPRRAATRLGTTGATGRPALEAGPHEGRAAVVLVHAVPGQVRCLVPVIPLHQAVAGVVVADDGLAFGFRAHAGAPKAPVASKGAGHRRASRPLLRLAASLAQLPGAPTAIAATDVAGAQEA